jgi:hypothetical protein
MNKIGVDISVWIYTQSNITSILFTWVLYTNTANIITIFYFNAKKPELSVIHLFDFPPNTIFAIRPMKIDIMFLVPARMGFICRTKIFHYSLLLINRLNKTPNWSPDQSLIAAFRKRNSNCIFLKILLTRMPLFSCQPWYV